MNEWFDMLQPATSKCIGSTEGVAFDITSINYEIIRNVFVEQLAATVYRRFVIAET